jgi:segregation and condensation protein A
MTDPQGIKDSFDAGSPLFSKAGGDAGGSEQLLLNIEGYEGPLDLLLTLARGQKVDLKQISILELVEQYLVFINEARRLRLELAADYLVMAAWLAYLKSRLLLPEPEDDGEPSAEELANRLQLQLQKLEALRDVAVRLMAHDRLGRDVFARGFPEGVEISHSAMLDVTLYDLLKAYADHTARHSIVDMRIERLNVFTIEEALERLERLLGHTLDWATLEHFLPPLEGDARRQRSAAASMFVAMLEMARQGKADIRQMEIFGPLYLRARNRVEE